MKKGSKPFLNFSFLVLIFLLLTSCFSSKTIIKNYRFFKDEKCDCITSHPIIVIGSQSNYCSIEKAICTRSNYIERRDSIYKLSVLKMQMEDSIDSETRLNQEIFQIDSLINTLKNDWTHLKIKTKWKKSADSNEPIILKQKIRYLNHFKHFKKQIGVVVYKQ